MEVETSRVHKHLNDQGRICSRLRQSERSFMARSIVMHVSISRSKFGFNCLQRLLVSRHSVEESSTWQHLEAYRSSTWLRSGLRNQRKARPREDLHCRQRCGRDDQVSFGWPIPVIRTLDGRKRKWSSRLGHWVFDLIDWDIEMMSTFGIQHLRSRSKFYLSDMPIQQFRSDLSTSISISLNKLYFVSH